MADALTTAEPTQPASADAAEGAIAARCGWVILARHGEPAQPRTSRMNAEEYRDWWAGYEVKGIKPGQTAPEKLKAAARDADTIIASIRNRAIETASAVAGDRVFVQHPIFVEAPLPPPPWPRWLRLLPRTWGVVARVYWVLSDGHGADETHRQAEQRADEAAAMICGLAEQGQKVLVVAHGYFNQRVGAALVRRGWRCVEDPGFSYWSARKFERR
ncbi:MAG: histidine phosphatase family protein [Caulobacter sp.]|nr:histidine phosphatase family protein [Caulobacter sp.]